MAKTRYTINDMVIARKGLTDAQIAASAAHMRFDAARRNPVPGQDLSRLEFEIKYHETRAEQFTTTIAAIQASFR